MPDLLVSSIFDTDVAFIGGSETDVRVAESNHRIANNLTLVSGMLRLQAAEARAKERALSRDDISCLLLEAAARIETVGRLHGRLASGEEELPLADILREVAEGTVASLARPGQAQLALRLSQGVTAPARPALSIALAVGELITNSLKYAHPAGVPCQIVVSCRQGAAASLEVEVCDDGIGLPEGLDPTMSGGLGLKLVRALAQQMGADLSFEDIGVGLAVRLRLSRPGPAKGCQA